MAGNNVVVDTNILIYFLRGLEEARFVIKQNEIYFSNISEIELLGYHKNTNEQDDLIELILSHLTAVPLNAAIQKIAINLRKKYKIEVPDAIIAATAIYLNCPLITADKALFKIKELEVVQFFV